MARFVLSTVTVIAVAIPAISAQTSAAKALPAESRAQPVAPCLSFPSDSSGEMALVSSFIPEPAYVDIPIKNLKKLVPLLAPAMPAEMDYGEDAARTEQSANKAEYILSQVGIAITDLLHKTPDLIAEEQVKLANIDSRQSYYQNTSKYVYRIVHKKNSSGIDALSEFRTNTIDQPIDQSPNHLGSVGFATLWLVFLPTNVHESRFRYVGEQLIGKRKTYVLAFSQKPEQATLQPVIKYGSGQCATPLQGIAWIDQSTFQIIRIQTDLLHSLPDLQLSQLRTVLTYDSVKISGLNLSLWLPTEVETTSETTYRKSKELHRYSHYRLFKATMKVLPGF